MGLTTPRRAPRRRPAAPVAARAAGTGALLVALIAPLAVVTFACNSLFGIDDLTYGRPVGAAGRGGSNDGGAGGTGGQGAASTSSTEPSSHSSTSTATLPTETTTTTTTTSTTTSTTTGLPPCAETYGTVGDYYLECAQTAWLCTFYVTSTSAGFDCNIACNEGGGECMGAEDVPGANCVGGTPILCSADGGELHCTCSRGCGDGPPCSADQVCSDGVCE